jgi:hypothetical protein
MNSQIPYNKDGTINAIPIITYHNIRCSNQVYNELPSTVMVPLFAHMMKYLHDNGFKVLTMNQLGYNAAKNILYLKNNVASTSSSTTTKPATTARFARYSC